MNKTQEIKLEMLKRDFLNDFNRNGNHEIKQFEVTDLDKVVMVFIEVGLIGDEGTMASILCRNTAMFNIGQRGALRHYNKATRNFKKTSTLLGACLDYEGK